MRRVTEPGELRAACDEARARGERVGLVPTMGALHSGHRSLVDAAVSGSSFVVVTIFVNPTQFGPNEDLARYPRTLEADCELARQAGAALVFHPAPEAIYAQGEETRVRVGATAHDLCGAHRPGHFEGVATVVTKLFSLVGASTAWFGRKDYQQLKVIERLAHDLFLPVTIASVPTVREADGLAMSSRNRYLAPVDRDRALAIARGLSHAARAFERGERRVEQLEAICSEQVARSFDAIDYVTLADPDTVRPFSSGTLARERALLAVAARLGATRLIDNVVLGEDAAPIAEEAS
jgi:pantoate--beta-alanine ligase